MFQIQALKPSTVNLGSTCIALPLPLAVSSHEDHLTTRSDIGA
jgi:hypothetical protein